MSDTAVKFEALENSLMRAWMRRDEKAVRKLISRDFLFMLGTKPLEMLDRPSFLQAIGRGLICNGYRFHEVHAQKFGKTVWFVAHAELDLQLGGVEWSRKFMLTDLWRKTMIGGWNLSERSLAPLETDAEVQPRIRRLQLWRN